LRGRVIQDQFGNLLATDASDTWIVSPHGVVGRYVLYNNSAFDGNNPAAALLDNAAIATDKVALMPGGTATFANYTSYNRGLNGIMVDISGLANPGGLGVSDFAFKVGNNSSPTTWSTNVPSPNVAWRDIGNGRTRITLTWADYAIQNQWLQVTVKKDNTGLAADDVFYSGNAIGETGNNAANAVVDLQDDLGARNHKTGFTPAPITNRYDFNRDRRVNATDELIARYNHSGTSPLQLIDLMTGAGQDFGLAAVLNDGIFTRVFVPGIGITLPTSVGSPISTDTLSSGAAAATSKQALPGIVGSTQKLAAHDTVLAAAQKPLVDDASSLQWAWLAEFEQMRTKKPSSKKDFGNATAVDIALAAYC